MLSAGDAGEIWGGVSKGWSWCLFTVRVIKHWSRLAGGVGQFLSLTLFKSGTWNSLVRAHCWSCFEQEVELLEVPSNLHYPMILSSGRGRGSILRTCAERSVRCRCVLMYQACTFFWVGDTLFSSVLNYFFFRWTCLCSRSCIPWVVETSRWFYFTVHAENNFAEQHAYKMIIFYLSGPFLSSRKLQLLVWWVTHLWI